MNGIGAPTTMDELRRRIEDAALTLRRLPPSKGSAGPAGQRSNMPDYVRDARESYGYEVVMGGRILADASAIGRMDEVFAWMTKWWSHASLQGAGLPIDAGIIAWHRCTGLPVSKIQAQRFERFSLNPRGAVQPPGGNSAPTIRKLADAALRLMMVGLGGDPAAQEPQEPIQVRFQVAVNLEEEHRVRMVRGEAGAFEPVVSTRHASARHEAVTVRRRG